MDQKAKDQFRMKFYRLAVQLNIIILLIVVPVLFLFIFPDGSRHSATRSLPSCSSRPWSLPSISGQPIVRPGHGFMSNRIKKKKCETGPR